MGITESLIGLMAYALACTGLLQHTAYILPAGYEGPVVILYKDPAGGRLPSMRACRTELEFGQDGVLSFREPMPAEALLNITEYYYRQSDGSLNAVPRMNAEYSESVAVFAHNRHFVGADDPGSVDEAALQAEAFYIGRPSPGSGWTLWLPRRTSELMDQLSQRQKEQQASAAGMSPAPQPSGGVP